LQISLESVEQDAASNPLSLVARRCNVETKPVLGPCLMGILLGLLGTLVAVLFIGTMQMTLPREQWGNSAAAGVSGLSQSALFFFAVILIPIFETFVGQVIPIEIARRLRANWAVSILISAIVFGCGHYLNGGLVHGISAFLGGAVFASGYVTVRWVGFWSGFLTAYTAHAVQNAMLLFVIARLVPSWA
jgi:hypothetical protein